MMGRAAIIILCVDVAAYVRYRTWTRLVGKKSTGMTPSLPPTRNEAVSGSESTLLATESRDLARI